MTHGNKKYYFEKLKTTGDAILVKPQPEKIRVNTISLKQQMKTYQLVNGAFNYDLEEHRNGSVTVTRTA